MLANLEINTILAFATGRRRHPNRGWHSRPDCRATSNSRSGRRGIRLPNGLPTDLGGGS
jgi:hypothetical protein